MFNRITLYGLINIEAPQVYLTIVNKKEHAFEYAKRILLLNHKSHFIQWCDYKKLAYTDPYAINLYYKDCISDEEKRGFKIVKFRPTSQEIAVSLRMFSGNIPLGCEHETYLEYQYVLDQLKTNSYDKDTLTLLENAAQINPYIKFQPEDKHE